MMRVFADDLELTMRKQFNQPELDIIKPKDLTVDQMMSEYLKNHFNIAVEGKPQTIKYLGHEIEGDAIVVYAYAPGVKKLKTIEVHHSTITEVYEDQSNLVHVLVGEKTRSLRLMRDSTDGKIVFE